MNDRHGLEFAVHYSIALCELHGRLWHRIGVGLCFLQMALGVLVLAGAADKHILPAGLLLLVLSCACILRPLETSLAFIQQGRQYQVLSYRMRISAIADDAALVLTLSEISERDLPELGLLTRPAELLAAIRMGTSSDIRLTQVEKWVSWLAGYRPRR